MNAETIKKLNLEQIRLLANIYWRLSEYLDLIHPPITGIWTRQYETTEDESKIGIDKVWRDFIYAIKSGSFNDRDLYTEIEADYSDTLKIIDRLKEMKKTANSDQRLKNQAWELLHKISGIHLMLSGEEVLRRDSR